MLLFWSGVAIMLLFAIWLILPGLLRESDKAGHVPGVWLLVVLLPIASIGLYTWLGDPAAIARSQNLARSKADPHGNLTDQKIESVKGMTARLAQRLEKEPDDPAGWLLLGRSYMAMEKYAQAAAAYAELYRLVGKQPGVMLRYADALGMMHGGRLEGKAFTLIREVMEMEPSDTTALWLASKAYYQRGEFTEAKHHLRKLETLLEGDPESLQQARQLIGRVDARLAEMK